MDNTLIFENELQHHWDKANENQQIFFRPDTLSTKEMQLNNVQLKLIHNACRDDYDRSQKAIDRPGTGKPFQDGTNPELMTTEDGWFRVIGNRFACMQYQSILVPAEPTEVISHEFLTASFRFASAHPTLTLMYNGLGAGKTVPNQFWLLSFAQYDALSDDTHNSVSITDCKGIPIHKRNKPCYALQFSFQDRMNEAVEILLHLVQYLNGRHFNMFLFNQTAFFIPRENIEVPSGFDGHKFGGLEMLGFFVMKSSEALKTADPAELVRGIDEISYSPTKQGQLEKHLQNLQ